MRIFFHLYFFLHVLQIIGLSIWLISIMLFLKYQATYFTSILINVLTFMYQYKIKIKAVLFESLAFDSILFSLDLNVGKILTFESYLPFCIIKQYYWELLQIIKQYVFFSDIRGFIIQLFYYSVKFLLRTVIIFSEYKRDSSENNQGQMALCMAAILNYSEKILRFTILTCPQNFMKIWEHRFAWLCQRPVLNDNVKGLTGFYKE